MVEYTLEERPGVLIARLSGSLDAYLRDFTPQLEEALRAKPRHLVVNLAMIDFIGSRGMGLLFHLHKVLRDLGKELVAVSLSQPAKDALEVGGIGSLLNISADEKTALAELASSPSRSGSKSKRKKKSSRAKSKGRRG